MANNTVQAKQYNKFAETNQGETAIYVQFVEADEVADVPYFTIQDRTKNNFIELPNGSTALRVVLGGSE